jgi:hypothetical protein
VNDAGTGREAASVLFVVDQIEWSRSASGVINTSYGGIGNQSRRGLRPRPFATSSRQLLTVRDKVVVPRVVASIEARCLRVVNCSLGNTPRFAANSNGVACLGSKSCWARQYIKGLQIWVARRSRRDVAKRYGLSAIGQFLSFEADRVLSRKQPVASRDAESQDRIPNRVTRP